MYSTHRVDKWADAYITYLQLHQHLHRQVREILADVQQKWQSANNSTVLPVLVGFHVRRADYVRYAAVRRAYIHCHYHYAIVAYMRISKSLCQPFFIVNLLMCENTYLSLLKVPTPQSSSLSLLFYYLVASVTFNSVTLKF